MYKIIAIIFCFSVTFATVGCSTMNASGGQNVMMRIKTIPDGARVIIGLKEKESPSLFALDPRKKYEIIIKKEGYKTVRVKLIPSSKAEKFGESLGSNTLVFGWWSFGIGTAAGMLVDAASGSILNFDTDTLTVELEKGTGELNIDAKSLYKKEDK